MFESGHECRFESAGIMSAPGLFSGCINGQTVGIAQIPAPCSFAFLFLSILDAGKRPAGRS